MHSNSSSGSLETKMRRMALPWKVFWILLALVVVRIGTSIPLPFVNSSYMESLFGANTGFLSVMLGDSLEKMSVFALSITPYITASIIVQLMTVAIPKLEEIKKDGAIGEKRYKKIINITGIVLAIVEAAGMAIGFGKQGLIEPYKWWTVLLCACIWIAGAAVLIWLGNLLENFNLGSGISMLLLCNIVASIPEDIIKLYEMYMSGKSLWMKGLMALGIAAVFAVIVIISAALVTSVRNIPITSSRKAPGNLAQQYFPIPFVTCSVMPIIFAGSLISIPQILSSFIPAMQGNTWQHIIKLLSPYYWGNKTTPIYSLGILIYVVLTYIFTLFYLEVEYNPTELADNLKAQGIVIPGIRPGRPTADYLQRVMTQTAIMGNWCLTAMVIISYVAANLIGIGSISLSGTSAIIAVSVVNDIYQRIKVEKDSGAKRRSSKRGFFVRSSGTSGRKSKKFALAGFSKR